MLEDLKWYLVNFGCKKYVPVGVMAAMTALGTFMAAHSGALEQYGVTYKDWADILKMSPPPSGMCFLIEMDTLSKAAITAIIAGAAMLFRAAQHHTTGEVLVPGGQRAGDPPAPPTPAQEVSK